jgi:ketosteroid isomerase-like protein
MLSWLAKRIVSRNMARMREGDYRPTLRLVAEDAVLRFPGESSWAGEWRGRSELEQ